MGAFKIGESGLSLGGGRAGGPSIRGWIAVARGQRAAPPTDLQACGSVVASQHVMIHHDNIIINTAIQFDDDNGIVMVIAVVRFCSIYNNNSNINIIIAYVFYDNATIYL